MKVPEYSLEEKYVINNKTKNSFSKRINEINSKSYHLIIIFILIIISFSFNFFITNIYFKVIKKIDDQNALLNKLIHKQDKINEKYKNSLLYKINNLSSKKKDSIELNNTNNIFLQKVVKKVIKSKNLILLSNFVELDNLFLNDKRYDGARNCLAQSIFNSTCIYNYLYPKKVIGKTRKLFGGHKSTGYVMLDDLDEIKIAYSFGIGDRDWFISFDKELADRNIDVFMYDHTINNLAYNNNRFHFHKIGLTGKKSKSQQLKSLEEILIENGHINETNMILKIDIEYSEWESLLDFPEEKLKNFKYMLFELHFLKSNFELYSKVLSKLNKYHQIFYVHCVNCGEVEQIGDMRICSALEVSYVIKEGHEFEKDDSIYPVSELETICKKDRVLDFNENIFKYFDY